MKLHNIGLNLEALENVKISSKKVTARCPACAAQGEDRSGNHLVIFEGGPYSCIVHKKENGHSKTIWQLVGIPFELRAPQRGAMRIQRESQERFAKARERDKLAELAALQRDSIIASYPWSFQEAAMDYHWLANHPERALDSRRFLAAMFNPLDLIWTGELNESGQQKYAERWRTCSGWSSAPAGERVGPMTTPCVWKEDSISRCESNVAAAPYVVLDFDGLKGAVFDTEEKLANHLQESFSITNWVRHRLCWKLVAIVYSGNKSIHAWFRRPNEESVRSMRAVAPKLGIDPQLLDVLCQPCRLPGHVHEKSGKLSTVLWLDESASVKQA